MRNRPGAGFLFLFVLIAASAGANLGAAPGEPKSSRATAVLRVRVLLPPSLTGAAPLVTLSTSAGVALPRAALLDSTRLATFDGLPPGAYVVRVEVPGGATATFDVRLEMHDVLTLEARVVPVAAGASSIVVVDRHRMSEGAQFRERQLRDLPAASDLWALIETAVPFVVVDRMDNGGLGTARSAYVSSRGASWTSTSITFGETQLVDPGRLGLLATAPDLGVVEAVAVSSGLAPVEVETPGVQVTLVPRQPSSTPRGTLQMSLTSSGMVATNALPDAPSIARIEAWRGANLVASGPVHPRAGLLVSTAMTRTRQQERDQALRLAAGTTSIFARAIAQPIEGNQLRLMAGVQRLSRPFDGRYQFADEDIPERAGVWQAQATWERIARSLARYSLSTSIQHGAFTPDVQSSVAGVVDRVRYGILPAPPAAVGSSQWELQGQFQARDRQWGEAHHGLRAGLTLRRSTSTSDVLALPVVAESVAGRPARVWQYVAPSGSSRRKTADVSGYLADRIEVTPAFTVDLGIRFDRSSGSTRGSDTGIAWSMLSPRAAFRWSAAPFAVFGGYGRYASRVNPFLLAYGDPGEPWANVYRWNDHDRDGLFDTVERGVLVARQGRGSPVASIDAGLRAPRTREFTFGAEVQLGRYSTVRGALIVRSQDDLLGAVNVGVPLSGYRVLQIPDQNADWHSPDDDQMLRFYERLPSSFGKDEFLLTNPADAFALYRGIEITWELTSARWQMLFGATAYRTRGWGGNRGFGVRENDQSVVGELFADPNAAGDQAGSFFFDRSYVGKWSASYHAPRDVRLAMTARYQDGQPFARVVVADLSTGPEMLVAYRVGRTRFTYTATMDARVEKAFRMAGRRVAVQLDVFNLTNHRNEVEEDVVTGPTFRRTTAVQPPRTLRLGFRFEF